MSEHPLPAVFITEESTATGYVSAIEAANHRVTAQENWDVPDELLDDYGDAQFEPFTLIAAAVSVGFLLKRISDVWADHSRAGGQIVDTRQAEVEIRRAPYLDRGTLVLVTDEGQFVYRPDQRDEALDAIGRIAPALG